MITLYFPNHRHSDAIREKIAEMCLAVHITTRPFQEVGNPQLPVLKDDATIIQGEKAILDYLEELADFKAEWEKFQSDSCYCGEDGEIE